MNKKEITVKDACAIANVVVHERWNKITSMLSSILDPMLEPILTICGYIVGYSVVITIIGALALFVFDALGLCVLLIVYIISEDTTYNLTNYMGITFNDTILTLNDSGTIIGLFAIGLIATILVVGISYILEKSIHMISNMKIAKCPIKK
jgi:hypothetical protein